MSSGLKYGPLRRKEAIIPFGLAGTGELSTGRGIACKPDERTIPRQARRAERHPCTRLTKSRIRECCARRLPKSATQVSSRVPRPRSRMSVKCALVSCIDDRVDCAALIVVACLRSSLQQVRRYVLVSKRRSDQSECVNNICHCITSTLGKSP